MTELSEYKQNQARGLVPPNFPNWWASDYGEDEYGIFMGFRYKGIRQGFRWIPPGIFTMGSPDDEPERFDNETLHEVSLTKGYWLAETACTQALWQAVMEENPSRFKGQDLPVENVSWEDVASFVQKLNSWQAELELRLPSEAEWEFGCRAGTKTPFFFGENITAKQVNCDGNLPYNGGEKGEYRKKPVSVKALEPNGWGLYEMHGNVDEWCMDWFENFTVEQVINPPGPAGDTSRVLPGSGWFDDGGDRVIRGGNWLYGAGLCRSASRKLARPSYRDHDLGFRLARGL